MKRTRRPFSRDLGTPELQAKRLASVVNFKTGRAGDPNMAGTELGRLCEQGYLHPEYSQARKMYDAGQTFIQLWRACYPEKACSTLSQFVPTSNGEIDLERAETDLKSLGRYLGARQLLDAVVNVCVYDRRPVDNRGPTKDLEKLRTGLMRIMEWQKNEKRLAA